MVAREAILKPVIEQACSFYVKANKSFDEIPRNGLTVLISYCEYSLRA